MRKIIQIVTGQDLQCDLGHTLYALCDDGTVWWRTYACPKLDKWQPVPDISQVNEVDYTKPMRPIYNVNETINLKWDYRIAQPSAYHGFQVLKVAARNVSEQKYKFGAYYKTKDEAIRAIEAITGMDFQEYEKIKYYS